MVLPIFLILGAVVLVLVLPIILTRHHTFSVSPQNPHSNNTLAPNNNYTNIPTNYTYPPDSAHWSGWGANIYNNRWASSNTFLNSTTVTSLTRQCYINYKSGGVSAAPVISGNLVYYPTWDGQFVALDYTTCKPKWQINVTTIIEKYAPKNPTSIAITAASSRTSPQLDGDVLYFGTQRGALLVAVDINTGATRGVTQVNPHPAAIITMSPTLYKGLIYVGCASQEEIATEYIPGYQCCTFIGNFAALSFDHSKGSFSVVWNMSMLPFEGGWAGSGVWGSQPSIDPVRQQVFIGTGNIYDFPDAYSHCENATAGCLPTDVYQDAVLALDLKKGDINWSRMLTPLDAWTAACRLPDNATLCPQTPGPDADFGMAPTFVPASLGNLTSGNDSVIIGQKNGIVYSFNAKSGDSQWIVPTSPDGDQGGLSWGLGIDAANIYFTAINYGSEEWHLEPSGIKVNNSAFGAMSLKEGAITWETAVPRMDWSYTPPTLVNDILLVGSSGRVTAGRGAFMALTKADGRMLVDLPVDSVLRGGIAVQDQYVMFGTGYSYANAVGNGSFYVMKLK